MDALQTLNSAQRAAVTADERAVLVLAGAGSGKTRVIVERIAWLVTERGVDPRNVLAITFTNRAANEMRSRVAVRLGVDRVGAWLGTFHAFGANVLRRHMDRLGRSNQFSIFDDSDQQSLMRQLVADMPGQYEKVSPKEALWWISRQKQEMVRPEAVKPAGRPRIAAFAHLWGRYEAALRQNNAVDFDDLLVLVVRLFDEHPDILERYRRRYTHVHVDEYQDTNAVQYHMVRRLGGTEGSVFVVGDEDQSIYSWRGANIRNVLEFERDFPNARVIRLEQNYRSTGPILAVANSVVANNTQRLGKTLWTEKKEGPPVRFYHAPDGHDEARFVAEDLVARACPPREVAVLYRTNAQSRLMEEALRIKGVAYVVVGGVHFYGRKEVKDILAYLRVAASPSDDLAVRRVVNVPTRGVGASTMARIEEYAAAREQPLFEVIRDVEHDQSLPARAREGLAGFVRLVDDARMRINEGAAIQDLVRELLARTDYRAYVQKTNEQDYRDRFEVLDEFVSACAEFDKQKRGGVLEFLQELALVSDADEYQADAPAVSLITCHSAKGLEFNHVYLIGLEEGLLPHATAQESDKEIEEERRLCYVAMTRACQTLTLTAAECRTMYGREEDREVSRFVGEVSRGLLVPVYEKALSRAPERKPVPMPVSGRKGVAPPAVAAGAGDAAGGSQLKLGTRVRHARYGEGTVMFTSGSGDKLKARIRFKTGRVHTFMVSMTPLEVLEGGRR